MDHLDRTYQHLVRTIRARFPQYESQPFDVAELFQTILPYRHHRRDLGLDTNDDYEMALTELLSGARDYLIVDDRMRDALRVALSETNPDPSAFKQFSDASVALSPIALRKFDAAQGNGIPTAEAPIRAQATASVTAPAPAPPPAPRQSASAPVGDPMAGVVPRTSGMRPSNAAVPAPRASAPMVKPSVPTPASAARLTPSAPVRPGERCRACDGVLPAGREITFCPHCGQNLTRQDCLACGAELELGWKFCPVCGRPVGGIGATGGGGGLGTGGSASR